MCPPSAREKARVELVWNIGLAFLPVVLVVVIVIFSMPLLDIVPQVINVIGRGELMIYAAALCGSVIYALQHNFDADIPDALKPYVTPLRTLTTVTGVFMFLAMTAYVVRRFSDVHHTPLNVGLLTWASVALLVLSVVIAYVVFSLKFSLASGAAPAARQQTKNFAKEWEDRDD